MILPKSFLPERLYIQPVYLSTNDTEENIWTLAIDELANFYYFAIQFLDSKSPKIQGDTISLDQFVHVQTVHTIWTIALYYKKYIY